MTENGIRKLKNILNEYEDYKEKKYGRRNYKWICYGKEHPRISADRAEGVGVNDCLFEDESRAVIISKGYNFIKRLVKNDKIDLNKVNKVYYKKTYCGTDGQYISYEEFLDEQILIMRLSIQDNPIEFLVSTLK